MSKQNKFSRRKVVSALGAIGAVGVGAGFASTAAAENVDAAFTVNDPDPVVNDEGAVTRYVVAVEGTVTWDGFDSPADYATVTLSGEVEGDDESKEIDSVKLEGLTNTHGSAPFSLEEDVTDVFGDEAFSVSDDGETVTSNLKLSLGIEVTPRNGSAVSASEDGTMALEVTNEKETVASESEATGSAGGYDSHYISRANQDLKNPDKFDPEYTEGAMELFISYVYDGNDLSKVLFDVELEEPWSDEDEPSANMALGIKTDSHPAFQIGWHASNGTFAKAVTDGSWNDISIPEMVSIDKDGESFHIEFDASGLGFGEGDAYQFVCNSSYGGEGEHVTISNDPDGKAAWDGTDTTYFLTEEIVQS
ncbi:hypothetical protein [Haloprofundus halophilus]|uniref:hypothetical protein n=1 Tax=Haloprofundus halophilus TaxID=2283527 RepID=UPI000E44B739|nr:hypothetical protein [Haloprofundus halophilus]